MALKTLYREASKKEKKNMWSMTFFPSLPVALRRVLVWGVPSLAILGLVGMASKRWLSISMTKKKITSSAPEQHATSDENLSMVDEVRSSCSKQEHPNQLPTSSVEFDPTCFQSHTPCVHTMRTSSNVLLPCVHTMRTSSDVTLPTHDYTQRGNLPDKEDPIKPELSSTCGLKHPTTHSEELQFEASIMETDVSGEAIKSLSGTSHNCSDGLLSSPCKLVSGKDTTDSSVQSKPCNNPDCSFFDRDKSACCQHNSELKENGFELSTDTIPKTPLISRKDRTRIQLQLPRDIIGRFIGKQGRNIKALMVDSDGAHIFINQKNLPKEAQFVPCTIQGSPKQVEDTLTIIESKFPEIIIPGTMINGVSMQQFHQSITIPSPLFNTCSKNNECLESWDFELTPASIPLNPFSALISYIESLTNVWMVSCEKSLELDSLHQSMSYTYCYTTIGDGLLLAKENDRDLLNKFCAVKVSEIHWLRGRVMRLGDDLPSYEVQLVDYGSCVVVPPSAIKPLRKEHCKLPVQAFKSQLANVKPKDSDNEMVSKGLFTMQQLVEAMVLEVHITKKIFVLPCAAEEKVDNISTTLLSSTSLSVPSSPVNAEPEVDNIYPEVSTSPAKFNDSKESLVILEDSGKREKMDSSGTSMSNGAFSSSGESRRVKKADYTCTNISNETLSSSGGYNSILEASGESSFSPSSGGESKKWLSSLLGENDQGRDNLPGEKGKVNSSSEDFGDVKKDDHSVCKVDGVESLLQDFSHLAPYVPVVELYTQLGAQTPIFINRELVELGHAIWIEDKNSLR